MQYYLWRKDQSFNLLLWKFGLQGHLAEGTCRRNIDPWTILQKRVYWIFFTLYEVLRKWFDLPWFNLICANFYNKFAHSTRILQTVLPHRNVISQLANLVYSRSLSELFVFLWNLRDRDSFVFESREFLGWLSVNWHALKLSKHDRTIWFLIDPESIGIDLWSSMPLKGYID